MDNENSFQLFHFEDISSKQRLGNVLLLTISSLHIKDEGIKWLKFLNVEDLDQLLVVTSEISFYVGFHGTILLEEDCGGKRIINKVQYSIGWEYAEFLQFISSVFTIVLYPDSALYNLSMTNQERCKAVFGFKNFRRRKNANCTIV